MLVVLAQQVAEQAWIVKLDLVDADFARRARRSGFFRLSLAFSYELDDDLAGARAIVEVHQDHLLPGAETRRAVNNRDCQRRPEQCGAQMGKTVVVAPAVVVVIASVGGNMFLEEFL